MIKNRQKRGLLISMVFLWCILLLTACSTRKVERTKERIKLVDKGTIERTAPGDRVYITLPATPNERPKDTTRNYKGEKGARTDVDFNGSGTVTGIRTDCPEINEWEQKNLVLDYDLKEKNIERTFNEMVIKEIKGLLLWMTGIVSMAWVVISIARAIILRK